MNRFIMANSQQCLGCHACEVACVMAHNDERHVLTSQRYQPRITVIKHQHQRSAVTCHHCEDAPCARSCPNGAIAHINDSVQVNAQKCIGCKSCVVACPFGTMQMVLTPVAPNQFKASAHKCDLCQGREQGPACVENCPADALQLVTEDSLTRLAKRDGCVPPGRRFALAYRGYTTQWGSKQQSRAYAGDAAARRTG